MSDAQDMVHPEAESLTSCEPVKPNKLCVSKTQQWNRHRIDTFIAKVRHRGKKEGGMGPKQIPNLARQTMGS